MVLQAHSLVSTFVAIDFETADRWPDSACALAAVRVSLGEITERRFSLIRPPRPDIFFTHIHGITWDDVASAAPFAEVWPDFEQMLAGAEAIAAHNAPFDRGVLNACCAAAGLDAPKIPFVCTVRVARRAFGLRRANLPAVCRHLGFPLKHHDAASDAEACARILMEAQKTLGP